MRNSLKEKAQDYIIGSNRYVSIDELFNWLKIINKRRFEYFGKTYKESNLERMLRHLVQEGKIKAIRRDNNTIKGYQKI